MKNEGLKEDVEQGFKYVRDELTEIQARLEDLSNVSANILTQVSDINQQLDRIVSNLNLRDLNSELNRET